MSDPRDLSWLLRLSPDDWLLAARGELARAYGALRARHRREGVTCARRAAGMALNAVLVVLVTAEGRAPDPAAARYGRSYMDHLRALATDDGAPVGVRAAAGRLATAPLRLELVPLGPGETDLADDAATVLEHAIAVTGRAPRASAPS